MFPISHSAYDVVLLDRRRQLEVAARHRQLADRPAPPLYAARRLALACWRVVGTLGARIVAVTYDSREGHRSQEHVWAARGIRWCPDPAADEQLAHEVAYRLANDGRATAAPAAAARPVAGGAQPGGLQVLA